MGNKSKEVIYRLHKGLLKDAMEQAKVVGSRKEVVDDATRAWSSYLKLSPKSSIVLEDEHGTDERIGWNDYGLILLKKGKEEMCIGHFCDMDKVDKSKPWNADSWRNVSD